MLAGVDVDRLAGDVDTGEVTADMKPDGALSGNVAVQFLGGNVGTNMVPAETSPQVIMIRQIQRRAPNFSSAKLLGTSNRK